ncbi:MAG TPA: hypothetical protein VNH20_02185 [Candidatus Dormibacteraeota bacterium]|nr:hypothetical protein [Candidatus Dormibacteraeota bacterium]
MRAEDNSEPGLQVAGETRYGVFDLFPVEPKRSHRTLADLDLDLDWRVGRRDLPEQRWSKPNAEVVEDRFQPVHGVPSHERRIVEHLPRPGDGWGTPARALTTEVGTELGAR